MLRVSCLISVVCLLHVVYCLMSFECCLLCVVCCVLIGDPMVFDGCLCLVYCPM